MAENAVRINSVWGMGEWVNIVRVQCEGSHGVCLHHEYHWQCGKPLALPGQEHARPRTRHSLRRLRRCLWRSALCLPEFCRAGRVSIPDGPGTGADAAADRAAKPVNLAAAENIAPGITPLYADGADLAVDVETPSGEVVAIDHPVLADMRFRANIYLHLDDAGGFAENVYVGRKLQVGQKVVLSVLERDPRCKMITLDPDTAEPHAEMLRTVTKGHAGTAGVYSAVLVEGTVARGDKIELLE